MLSRVYAVGVMQVLLRGGRTGSKGRQSIANKINKHSNPEKLLYTVHLRAVPPKSTMLSSKITSRPAENLHKSQY